MFKSLVFGDLHLDDKYSGYLDNQVETIYQICKSDPSDDVVFLGDVFHYRKPSPEVLLAFKKLMDIIPQDKIYVLRGNHDSSTKADDGITSLSLFNSDKVKIIEHTWYSKPDNYLFIPHYEDENEIIKSLNHSKINKDTIVFGHFGYHGSLNSAGDMDFNISKEKFKNTTFLGHIHKHHVEGNITVLGTPWSTSFAECDYEHYYATIEGEGPKTIQYKKINRGVRYLVYPYEALEANESSIKDSMYFTVLRVLLSRFDDANTVDLRKTILETYKSKYVDLKFIPSLKSKFDRLSNFETTQTITEITDELIDSYLDENQSQIPNKDLKIVLEDIRNAVKNSNTK